MTPVKVAIIGAGGKVGSTILKELHHEPALRVRGVCRNEVTAGPMRLAGFDVVCGDISDVAQAERLVEGASVIINCAAASGPPGRARAQDEAVLQSLAGLSGKRRIIHFSSVAVYGTCIDANTNTFEHPRPDDPYGRDKLHLESFLRKRLARGHEVVVLRLGHVYGVHQWVSRYAFTFQEEGVRLPFDGRLASNAVHVRNVAAGIRALALGRWKDGTLNLIDAPSMSWREVFDWNTRAAGLTSVPGMDEAESDELRAYFRALAGTPLPQRAATEVAGWLRTLPRSLISSAPAMKAGAAIVLANLKVSRLEQYASMAYTTAFASTGERSRLYHYPKMSKLLCDAAPGPCLQYTPVRDDEDSKRVGEWYREYSRPDPIREAANALVSSPASKR